MDIVTIIAAVGVGIFSNIAYDLVKRFRLKSARKAKHVEITSTHGDQLNLEIGANMSEQEIEKMVDNVRQFNREHQTVK